MRRVFLLLAVLYTVVLSDGDERFNKCAQLIHPVTLSCCKSKEPMQDDGNENFNECYQLPHTLASCNRDTCIASKLGFASLQGVIDKNGLRKHLHHYFKNDTGILKMVTEKCVDSDLHKYGPKDLCELKKLKLCIYLQLSSQCSKWDTKGLCAEVKELTDDCMKLPY